MTGTVKHGSAWSLYCVAIYASTAEQTCFKPREVLSTFKKEARRARLQGVLNGLNLAGDHAEDLCLDAAAAHV